MEIKGGLGNLGICIKSLDGKVEHQDSLCTKICGNQLGKKCEKGCMACYTCSKIDSSFDLGFHHIRNIKDICSQGSVEAILINDGIKLTTLFLNREEQIQRQLQVLSQFELTKSELVIMQKFLLGYKAADIADQLCISRKTLRTHLNNIYKKIPPEFKEQILVTHLTK